MDLAYPRPSLVKNLIVTLVCLLGIATASWLLLEDFRASRQTPSGSPVGTVESSGQDVRRKPSSSYVWDRVTAGSTLYARDSVKIGQGSFARIKLFDGSELDLGENSLIILDETKELSLGFVRGSFIVRDAKGDREVSVGTDGRTVSKTLQARLLAPQPAAAFFSLPRKSAAIAFRWRLSGGAVPPEGLTVQVASNREFTANLRRIPPGASGEAAAELPEGIYFWRLVDKSGSLSETRPLKVDAVTALRPLWPDMGRKVSSWASTTRVPFRWTGDVPESRGEHRLEIARDAGFTQLIASESIDPLAGGATLTAVPLGTLHWRLLSRYGEMSVRSDGRKFFVERVEQLEVEVQEPRDNLAIERPEQLRFAWAFSDPEASFRWELQAEAPGAPINGTDTRAPVLTWDSPAAGSYRWRVLALKEGNTIGSSPWRKLRIFAERPIELVSPVQDEKFFFWEKSPALRFAWKELDNLSGDGLRYRVRIARDPDLKATAADVTTGETELDGANIRLTPGAFFWRVDLTDAKGRVLRVSPLGRFVHDHFPPLGAPAVEGPEPGKVFNAVERDDTPVVRWKESESARGYVVRVRQDQKIILERRTKGTFLRLTALKAGQYDWSVSALDPLDREGSASAWSPFGVVFGKRLRAPVSTEWEVE